MRNSQNCVVEFVSEVECVSSFALLIVVVSQPKTVPQQRIKTKANFISIELIRNKNF